MKRAYRHDNNLFAASDASEPKVQEQNHVDHGIALRKFVWLSHLSNKTVDATFIAELAWHITKAGGKGMEDLGASPESTHKSDHIRLLLGQEFKDPNLYYVKSPLFNKHTGERVECNIPMHLPSAIFEEQFSSDTQSSETEQPTLEHLNFSKWQDHPVRIRHKGSVHWSRIRPVSLYWDGVQYTIRDTFFGLYMRDLITNVSHLIVLVR